MRRGFLLLFLVGCSSSDPPSTAPVDTPVTPPAPCADGFTADARGLCLETIAPDDCRPGTRPQIGSKTCVPVGVTTGCDHDDPSGWGCIDQPAPTACEGATREANGACIPIGDCDAAFPPAGAIVVDGSLATEDATHKKTIAAALAIVTNGATIAIERGTYPEAIHLQTSNVSIIGRCAAQTILQSAGVEDPGILLEKAKGTKISGLTLKGAYYGGIDVYDGSDATIEDVVVDGPRSFGIIADASTAKVMRSKVSGLTVYQNRGGWGISAGAGAQVDVLDVNIVGGTSAVYAGTNDATINVFQLVASGQKPDGTIRAGGVYSRGGVVSVEKSVIHDITADAAIAAEGTHADITVRNTVMRDIHLSPGIARGYGVSGFAGAKVVVRSSSIIRADSAGAFMRDSGTRLELHQTVARGPEKATAVPDKNLFVSTEGAGIGVVSSGGASVILEDVAIIEPFGWGVYMQSGSTCNAQKTLVKNVKDLTPNRTPKLPFAIGLASDQAMITVNDVAVVGTKLGAVLAGKKGTITGSHLYVRDLVATDFVGTGVAIGVGDGAKIDLDASVIFDSTTSGISAEAGVDASVRFAHGSIHGTRASRGQFGHGVVVAGGASVSLEATSVFENAAIGVAASGGRARLLSCVIADNPVALHVQGGSFITESPAEDDLGDDEVRVAPDNRFVNNATKLGSGEIPLPENVLP